MSLSRPILERRFLRQPSRMLNVAGLALGQNSMRPGRIAPFHSHLSSFYPETEITMNKIRQGGYPMATMSSARFRSLYRRHKQGRSYRSRFSAGQLRLLHLSRTCIVTFARIGYTIRPTTGNWRSEDFHLARFTALSTAPLTHWVCTFSEPRSC